ncbi:MAG: hypothetical protein HZT40_11085 [Candidatus Thiothrix singaporensis]|uniref:DnrO protein n=1 Tax=Candidatus Thiothrix singaporensis TaxID=2799669 RepID=A0A7L6AY99_9GAMM|nr:MAG: hypothetical protein HZT40_11085 [Candidatus Thiothrix singaporensis]
MLFLAASVLLVGAAVFVEHHWTGHDGHAQHTRHGTMALNNGQRWATDEALRTGMQRIHDAAQQNSPDLAQTTRQQTDYLIANCKLEPQADATLHGIIAQLLAGADALEKDSASAKGMETIRRALQQYPEYFDHPGWQP